MTAPGWRVRRHDGRTSLFESDIAIQRWILDGVLRADEELAQSGDTWRPLGSIPQFEAFFAAAEAARPRVAVPAPAPPEAPMPRIATESTRPTSATMAVRRRSGRRIAVAAVVFTIALAVEWVGLFEREAASSILRLPAAVLAQPRVRAPARADASGCPTVVARSDCERAWPREPDLPTPPPAIVVAEVQSLPAVPAPALPPIEIAAGTATTSISRSATASAPRGVATTESRPTAARSKYVLGAAEALANIAQCLWTAGDDAGARERFAEALQKNPFHPASLRGLERMNEEEGGRKEP